MRLSPDDRIELASRIFYSLVDKADDYGMSRGHTVINHGKETYTTLAQKKIGYVGRAVNPTMPFVLLPIDTELTMNQECELTAAFLKGAVSIRWYQTKSLDGQERDLLYGSRVIDLFIAPYHQLDDDTIMEMAKEYCPNCDTYKWIIKEQHNDPQEVH